MLAQSASKNSKNKNSIKNSKVEIILKNENLDSSITWIYHNQFTAIVNKHRKCWSIFHFSYQLYDCLIYINICSVLIKMLHTCWYYSEDDVHFLWKNLVISYFVIFFRALAVYNRYNWYISISYLNLEFIIRIHSYKFQYMICIFIGLYKNKLHRFFKRSVLPIH